VPSERAFSTMNLLQNKLRSRLDMEVMDKLCFIYINSRSLQRARGQLKGTKQKDYEEFVNDILLNLEDEVQVDVNDEWRHE
jgi:hypothetical protein